MIFGVPSDRKMPSLCQLMMTGSLWGSPGAWITDSPADGRPFRCVSVSIFVTGPPSRESRAPAPFFSRWGAPKCHCWSPGPGPSLCLIYASHLLSGCLLFSVAAKGGGRELKCSPVASLDDLHRKRDVQRGLLSSEVIVVVSQKGVLNLLWVNFLLVLWRKIILRFYFEKYILALKKKLFKVSCTQFNVFLKAVK